MLLFRRASSHLHPVDGLAKAGESGLLGPGQLGRDRDPCRVMKPLPLRPGTGADLMPRVFGQFSDQLVGSFFSSRILGMPPGRRG